MKKPEPPDFLEVHRPRHDSLEQLQKMRAHQDRAEGLKEYLGTFTATIAPPEKAKTLIDMYLGGDMRQLYQDLLVRGDHYDERQREIIEALMYGHVLDTPATNEEKNDLFLQFMRSTEAQRSTADRNTKLTAPREEDEIVLEDGRTLEESVQDERVAQTFEKQDFDDEIII